jgi:hypothetical protein
MKRNTLQAVAASALVLGIGAFFALRTHVRNELMVVNLSGVPIESLEVSLPWETLEFGHVEPGASTTQAFAIEHDAHFEISGKLKNGTPIHDSNGYVTNGQYGVLVRVEIEQGGSVRFSQNVDAARQSAGTASE